MSMIFCKNFVVLRRAHGYTQETIVEKCGRRGCGQNSVYRHSPRFCPHPRPPSLISSSPLFQPCSAHTESACYFHYACFTSDARLCRTDLLGYAVFSSWHNNAPFMFYSVCYFTVSHKGSISHHCGAVAVFSFWGYIFCRDHDLEKSDHLCFRCKSAYLLRSSD